jgi:four helix bundle protein
MRKRKKDKKNRSRNDLELTCYAKTFWENAMEKMEPIFDLHERTFRFAVQITKYVRTFPRDVVGFEYGKQLIRCGCSPGSNYEEADECASPKDFIYKIRTCLKESKETRYWLIFDHY